MINLIKNEIKKIKLTKFIISYICIIFVIYLVGYYSNDYNSFSNSIYKFIPFLGIAVCILFSNIVNNEINNGTMRYYLTKPYSRWKVLLSKFILMIVYVLILYLLVSIFYCLFSLIFYSKSISFKIIRDSFSYYIPIIFLGSISLYFSIIIKSSALSSCLSLVICLLSSVISELLFGLNINFIEYTFFPYVDYSIFSDKEYLTILRNSGIDISINKSGVILVFYILLFVCLSINNFTKKDIKS